MMSRGIGRAENEARLMGASCRYCGKLHYEQHQAKNCAARAERRRLKRLKEEDGES